MRKSVKLDCLHTIVKNNNYGNTAVNCHDLAEVVSVTSYIYAENRVKPCEGEASLEYLRDVAQEAAEHLSAHRDHLGTQSYLEVLERFPVWVQAADEEYSAGVLDQDEGDEDDLQVRESRSEDAGLLQLDEKITQAMANMDYPPQWKNTDSQQREVAEIQPKETLLHLAGAFASSSLLISSPGPVADPAPGVFSVWSDSSRMLRFCPGTNSLTLTVRQAPGSCPQEDIVVLRDRLEDRSILRLINMLRADTEIDKRSKDEVLSNVEGISKEIRVEEHVLVDNVFEEQLVLSLDDDDDVKEYPSSLSVCGHAVKTGRAESQFTQHDTDPLLSTINSSDKKTTQRSQADDVDLKCNIGGVTRDSTGTDSGLWDSSESQDLPLATDTPPAYSENLCPYSVCHSPPLSPADQAPARLSCPTSSEQTNERDSPPMDACDLREIRFRNRAQSADDEGSMELAESLQHLTLSEFLKEIEEEELDKYSIPTKVESEKYKVIRTFSFLKSRMSSTRNKTKGKGKEREAKDRQLNGHRFATGPCLGPTMCIVCDKPASGKDLLHCSKTSGKIFRDNGEEQDGIPPTDRHSESSETESDAVKVPSHSEELLPTPTSSTSTDSSFGEDCVDTCVQGDISADAADYEAESWSLTVEHKFCKRHDKRAVKRQDVIYELMQTELHHLQTLHIMAEVFRRGMREEVQLDTEAVKRVFPCLDQLLVFHHGFFAAMKELRHSSAQPQGHRNYHIQRIGHVLLQQFADENGEKMKQVYGEFCSRHNEAVSFFKELQQHNKRFQNFIKQQGYNSLVRRREIPECILLVTQRITKYPVLLERILHYTQEDTEECADLSKALSQIRDVIAAVDLRVSEYDRHQRLQEVWNRMENRSSAKLKNGHTFRKQDIMWPGQTLKHQGLLLWKTATGRLKDVLALLLTDALIFLQEKDQKYTFAAVDQKPPVIALQKLIVREVANEERGMFLISASSAGPEMYEVHTSSKEERNTWMRLIREAVESCPEEEEGCTSESEEEKRAAEARVLKIHKLQGA
ncbi:hypothetical protein F2P81_009398 [Scophthalmus maximus]|uniref:Rho guanine nucleotide exchange factor 28-like n=1 Tax=Scophthalmus maximus TaxID=52904 RepID=A0A6A4T6W3_SCOMX|nr:hypothetical protein F2P81_009398 [Scophthalmus maximus]